MVGMAVIEEVVFVLGSMLGVTVIKVVTLVLVFELVLVFGFLVLGMLVVGSLVLVLGFVLLGTIVVGLIVLGLEIVLVLVLCVFGACVGVPQKSGGSLSVYPDVGSMTSLAFVNASMRNKMYCKTIVEFSLFFPLFV